MKINGEKLPTLAVFPSMMTVPDCVVVNSNKIGIGHGEKKFYISSKEEMRAFYGGEKFKARCFLLKNDLIAYLYAIKNEYIQPSQNYRNKGNMPLLWEERLKKVKALDDVIFFYVFDQYQISGSRGYINSDDYGYQVLRELALPLVSYVYVEKVGLENDPMYYWKLFVDFNSLNDLVFRYGTKKNDYKKIEQDKPKSNTKEISKARDGQGKYREKLLEQCRYCPFTMIADERLLIASHIKPWAASNNQEKIDPFNGYMLSPLYDKLFDRGFITFTSDKHVLLSNLISSYTWKLIGLKNNSFIRSLPMDYKRIKYLEFHHNFVFKGSFD